MEFKIFPRRHINKFLGHLLSLLLGCLIIEETSKEFGFFHFIDVNSTELIGYKLPLAANLGDFKPVSLRSFTPEKRQIQSFLH